MAGMEGMRLIPNSEIEAKKDEEAAIARDTEYALSDEAQTRLAAHVRRAWNSAYMAKRDTERRMIKSLRQRNGEYDPEKLALIREQGGSDIFMMLTAVKCRAAKSWIRDVLMPAGDKPWEIKPTPIPDLPPEVRQKVHQRVMADAHEFIQATGQGIPENVVQQVEQKALELMQDQLKEQAQDRADKMSDLIEDQLTESGWTKAFDQFVGDVVDFQAGILKGPIPRRRSALSWEEGLQGLEPVTSDDIVPDVERVSPFDFYPAPGAEDVDDGDMIERHSLRRSDLFELIGVPGYDEDAIRRVLQAAEHGSLAGWLDRALDTEIDAANDQSSASMRERNRIDALEFWGEVPGSMLMEWGVDEIDDPQREYSVCCWLIGGEVIKAELNYHPLGGKPYSKACFEPVPGSFWGRGVPDLIRDCQDVCNAAARALVNNMAMASGPQVAVDPDSVPPEENVTQMFPWKIWQLRWDKNSSSPKPPIHFFQPNAITKQLMDVFDRYNRMADDYSGIPPYAYGSGDVGGAGKTASGLSMLMSAASKAIKSVIAAIDTNVISPVIYRYYIWNMRFHDDPSVKGDAHIVARGALALIAKEQQQLRRQEALQASANPIDFQIMGPGGRAELWRRHLQGMDLDDDGIIPGEDELRQRLMQQAQGAAGGQGDQGQRPREQLPDGSPAGGRDANVVSPR